MKNIVIVVLLAATIGLGALCAIQNKKLQAGTAQLAQTESQLAAREKELQEQTASVEKAKLAEQKATILQQTLTDTSAAAVEKTRQVEKLQQSLASAKTNDTGNLIAGMFKDPKMKEMIKSQQKLFMGPMIDKNYGELFKQLNLTPDQTSAVKDLLTKKMLVASDNGMSLMDGSLDASQRADLVKQMKTQTDGYDAQIKDMLGDANYPAFQTYEKTMPDRMAVSQFNDQLAGSGTPLSADQQAQLTQAMNEERTNFKWSTDYSNKNPKDGDMAAMFSEDKLNQFAQEKAQFDQQFLTRAQQILTPTQATAFEQFQTMQREMQITGMKLAGKMFAPKGQ
jgi:hypothetical protein